MAARLSVEYLDGRTVEVVLSPRVQIEAEAQIGGVGERNVLTAMYRMAWLALHRSGQEPADFDAWLDLISDVTKADTAEAADPTLPVPPTDGSSD